MFCEVVDKFDPYDMTPDGEGEGEDGTGDTARRFGLK